jgi:hypothetical protein
MYHESRIHFLSYLNGSKHIVGTQYLLNKGVCESCSYCWQYGGFCDQKTSIYFVSHREESMAGHVGVNGFY